MKSDRKTFKSVFIASASALVMMMCSMSVHAASYYISQSQGDDSQSGTSAKTAWKTFERAKITFKAGDKILLKCGDTWDETLRFKGDGTPTNPIFIGSYGEGPKPVIDRKDYNVDNSGIHLYNQGGIKIVGIEFAHCMTGIYAEYSKECPTKKFVWIEDCYFHDALKYQHYEDYPNRKIGLGICYFSHETANRFVLTDMMIKNCVFRRLASAVWTNSPDNFNKNASFIYNFGNLVMEDCLFEQGFQWQQGIRGVDKGAMRNCVTHDIGEGFRSFNGVAGSMFFRCRDWIFENCEWGFISIGLGSGDGEAFDFEGNCDNMTMRNCLFHDTDGPGFLLCCYASDGNPNKGILMQNCVINGKSKRPIGLPRCAIVNTTDWTDSRWEKCVFYLSPGEALMKVMDPEQDKRTGFYDCLVKNLSAACSTERLKGKFSASSEAPGSHAAKAGDANGETAWKAAAGKDQWLQLDFGKSVPVNEFKIKEDPSSAINRYTIEYWDEKTKSWANAFNGMHIKAKFVAPIVGRQTSKVRILFKGSADDSVPAIREFEAYYDISGEAWNDPKGEAARHKVGS